MATTEWFKCLDGIWHWDIRRYFNLKMHMIFVWFPSYHCEWRIFLANLFKGKMKLFDHVRLQPLVSILGSPHYVVQMLIRRMIEALDSHRDEYWTTRGVIICPLSNILVVPFLPVLCQLLRVWVSLYRRFRRTGFPGAAKNPIRKDGVFVTYWKKPNFFGRLEWTSYQTVEHWNLGRLCSHSPNQLKMKHFQLQGED